MPQGLGQVRGRHPARRELTLGTGAVGQRNHGRGNWIVHSLNVWREPGNLNLPKLLSRNDFGQIAPVPSRAREHSGATVERAIREDSPHSRRSAAVHAVAGLATRWSPVSTMGARHPDAGPALGKWIRP